MSPMDEEYRAYRAEQAHAYLERVRRAGESCAGLREMVDDARERASGLRGVDYSAVRVSTSPTADAVPDAVAHIQELVGAYASDLAAYEGMRHEANMALLSMDDATLAKALRLRYLCGWNWERVCVDMRYSWDGMMKLRRRALAEFWEVMPRDARDPVPPAV